MRSITQRCRPRRSLLSTPRRAMRGTMPPPAAGAAAAAAVVGLVGVQLGRALARPAGALPDRRHGVEQGLEEPAVVHVRGAQQERERDAAGVDQDVALGAGLAAVGRVRADAARPPFGREARRCRASSGRSRSRSPGRGGRAARGGAARRPRPPASRAAVASRSCRSRSPAPGAGSPTGCRCGARRRCPPAPCGRRGVDGRLSGAGVARGAAARSAPRARRGRAVRPSAQANRLPPARGGSVTRS